MKKHLQKFMMLQLSPYMSESESNERVELFLRYLEVICEHSLNDQDFEVLRRRLENIAECDYLDSDSLDQALSIEPFLRELYCLDTGDHSQVSFSKVMISFNVFPKNYLDNNQESWIFNTAPETASTKNYFKNLFYPFTVILCVKKENTLPHITPAAYISFRLFSSYFQMKE